MSNDNDNPTHKINPLPVPSMDALLDQITASHSHSHAQNTLASARRDLLLHVEDTLNDHTQQNWQQITSLHEIYTNFARRLTSRDNCALRPGAVFQPARKEAATAWRVPEWRDLGLPAEVRLRAGRERVRSAGLVRGCSEPKGVLVRKLREGAREEVEYLRRLREIEEETRRLREILRDQRDLLNARMVLLGLHDGGGGGFLFGGGGEEPTLPSMEELVAEELSVRGRKPKRAVRRRLRKCGGEQGMLRLLKEKEERYPEERVLPWEDEREEKKAPWWKRAAVAFRRDFAVSVEDSPVAVMRFSFDSLVSTIPPSRDSISTISTTTTASTSTTASRLSFMIPAPVRPAPRLTTRIVHKAKSLRARLIKTS